MQAKLAGAREHGWLANAACAGSSTAGNDGAQRWARKLLVGAVVNLEYVIGIAITLLLAGYLVYALLRPERF